MADESLQSLVRNLHRLAGAEPTGGQTDQELLEAFCAGKDSASFAALVRRHGAMVLRVCRAVLDHEQDAEDAFQATFLVLAGHAAGIRKRGSLASWLHGVAHRTALSARRDAGRRRTHERRADTPRTPDPAREVTWREVQAALDEEVERLPEKYRAALVLCVLEGKSGAEAARELGLKEATVWSRVSKARSLLRARLTARGLSGPAVLAAVALAAGPVNAVPRALVQSTVKIASSAAAAGVVSERVAALAAGVYRAMMTKAKMKVTSALLLVAVGLAAVSGAVVIRGRAAPPPDPVATAAAREGGAEADQPAGAGPVAPAKGAAADLADAPRPLKDAVEDLNRRTAEYLRPWIRQGTMPEDRLPAPVTVDEVVAAIRGWDRKKVTEVEAPYYRIYQGIAETKTLPPGAKLDWSTQWVRPDETDKFEHHVWAFRLDLNLKMGKSHGYGFLVRNDGHRLWSQPAPAPGYTWLGEPHRVTRGSAGWFSDHVVSAETGKDGALVVAAGWPHRKGVHDVRVVAFDAEGNRHLPAQDLRWGGVTSEFAMFRFRLDPAKLPAKEVRHVGLEALDDAGLGQASEAAVRRAKEKGIRVLPLPEVGRPYKFTLAAADGKVIDSRNLRGKVVLVDCWASWCKQCLNEMPELKKLYEAWHEKGLEVVGVSLDQDSDKTAAAVKRLGLPWPSVVAAGDEEVQRLWREATRITEIPRYLVIDQKGVLRADTTSPEGLGKLIADLLADNPKPP